MDLLEHLYSCCSDLTAAVVKGPFDQEHKDLPEVHFSLFEAELSHHLANNLLCGRVTSRREMIIRGFCLSTGTNLTLSYSLHTFRHSFIAMQTSATGCLKIVMSCFSEISLALAFISETKSYKGYSFL